MTSTLTYEIASQNGLLVAEADGSNVLLVNLDTVNTIYMGTENSFGVSAGSPDSVPLAPQASMVADGSTDWYAAIPTGQKAQLASLPGGTQFDNPVGVQIALSALGLATAANQNTQNNTALATNNVLGTGIALPLNAAKETGGALAGVNNNTFAASNFLGGTNPGALTAVAGKSIAQDMLHANSGTTTEIAALLASGSAVGTPGGVPLLNLFSLLFQSAKTSIAGNSATGFGGQNSNQPGTEGMIQLWNNGAAASVAIPVAVYVVWDDGAGNIVDVDSFSAFPAQASNLDAATYTFRTPTKALHVGVTVVNPNATAGNSIFATVTMWQSSRIFNRFEARSMGLQSSGLFNPTGQVQFATSLPALIPSLDVFKGVYSANPTIATGVTQLYLLPLLNGRATVMANTASDTTDLQVVIAPIGSEPALAAFPLNQESNAQGFVGPYEINMPPVMCQVELRNSNAASKAVNFFLSIDRTV